jgi:ubiquinone/menaquinone biosynthesis C-methylase UbiE
VNQRAEKFMKPKADLYNTSYSHFTSKLYQGIRNETYGEDLGQSSWMTASELLTFIRWLKLKPSSHLLEVGSGSGGTALFIARQIGCKITGVDINEHGVRNANLLASSLPPHSRPSFRLADASRRLPFKANQFDALICNDSICHIPSRDKVFRDWLRILKPNGLMLFSDALIVNGVLSHEEIARRSAIGRYFFLPPGENERLVKAAGFNVARVDDLTKPAAAVAKAWQNARASRAQHLIRVEGAEGFAGLQEFLWCVHVLLRERRLCRYSYVARKPWI